MGLAAAKARSWMRRRPLLAKMIPTATGFMFGDFLTQLANKPKDKKLGQFVKDYNLGRTGTMGAAGALVAAPVCLAFLRWMDTAVYAANPNAPLAVGVKFISDQIVGCILWQLAFLSIHPPYRQSALQLVRGAQTSIASRRELLVQRLY